MQSGGYFSSQASPPLNSALSVFTLNDLTIMLLSDGKVIKYGLPSNYVIMFNPLIIVFHNVRVNRCNVPKIYILLCPCNSDILWSLF